jgi:hypothetical protein
MATQLNITGTGFSNSGGYVINVYVNYGVTNPTEVTSYTGTATATGGVTQTIQLSTITGITTATSLTLQAVDSISDIKSNMVSIPITTQVINPAITATYNTSTNQITVSGTGFSASSSTLIYIAGSASGYTTAQIGPAPGTWNVTTSTTGTFTYSVTLTQPVAITVDYEITVQDASGNDANATLTVASATPTVTATYNQTSNQVTVSGKGFTPSSQTILYIAGSSTGYTTAQIGPAPGTWNVTVSSSGTFTYSVTLTQPTGITVTYEVTAQDVTNYDANTTIIVSSVNPTLTYTGGPITYYYEA